MASTETTQFGRVVDNMVSGRTLHVGTDVLFGLGPATINAWRPRAGVFVFEGVDLDDSMEGYRVVRTVGVCRGGTKTWEVIGDGQLGLGETRGLAAALGIALDYVSAPAWAELLMAEADPCGC